MGRVVLEKQGTPSFIPTPLSTRAASIRGLDVESTIACLADSVIGLCVSMGEDTELMLWNYCKYSSVCLTLSWHFFSRATTLIF